MASRPRRRSINDHGSRRSAPYGNSRKVRYAIIGLGHIAQVAVLPGFKQAKRNSELVALVSHDRRKLQALGKRYGVKRLCRYEELDDLYASGEIDAVYIALPNNLHGPYAVHAASAGMHVLCEKPMAVTVADCNRMIEAASAGGVKLMIAYRLHFERANLEAVKVARSGKLGDIRYFDSAFSFQVREGNIRVSPEDQGGGPIFDIGIYCINAARYLLAAEPLSVQAIVVTRAGDKRFRNAPETISVIMEFPEERVATFTCSFGSADAGFYQVVGTKGSLRMDPAYEYAEGLAYELKIGERTSRKKFGKSDQFAPELLYFSDCVLGNRDPEPSGEEGLADLRVIEAIQESARTGRRVALNAQQRARRPTLRQEIRRPAHGEPKTVRTQQPHH